MITHIDLFTKVTCKCELERKGSKVFLGVGSHKCCVECQNKAFKVHCKKQCKLLRCGALTSIRDEVGAGEEEAAVLTIRVCGMNREGAVPSVQKGCASPAWEEVNYPANPGEQLSRKAGYMVETLVQNHRKNLNKIFLDMCAWKKRQFYVM